MIKMQKDFSYEDFRKPVEPIIPVWKVTRPGEHTAFCPSCDVELELGDAEFTVNHPVGTPGEQFFVCPVCHGTDGNCHES